MATELTDELRFYILHRRRAENHIVHAFRSFRKNGIEPILIKGWAAGRNYPPDVPRFFGDIDLAVAEADFAKARALIDDPELKIGGIDLHRELRHLDAVPWDRLIANSELADLDDIQIRILSPEDHLRVISVHWLNNGGEDRQRLWDVVYAVRNRPASFDWSKCLEVVSPTRRRWTIVTIGLAHKYLGLEIDDLPFADEARDLPGWLTECLEKEWEFGIDMRALESQLRNPSSFWRQLRKRIPPNPIQATIDCEGSFDARTRYGYQLRNFLRRLTPSVKRIAAAAFEK
jgi:hypothetical protein